MIFLSHVSQNKFLRLDLVEQINSFTHLETLDDSGQTTEPKRCYAIEFSMLDNSHITWMFYSEQEYKEQLDLIQTVTSTHTDLMKCG